MRIDGERIKEARRGQGLTREDMRRICRLSTKTIYSIEEGSSIPGLRTLMRLTEPLGLRLQDVILE